MIDLITTIRCKIVGVISKNVKIDLNSRFNRRRFLLGLSGLNGNKSYPIKITKSNLSGNFSINYGVWILNSDMNTGKTGKISIYF